MVTYGFYFEGGKIHTLGSCTYDLNTVIDNTQHIAMVIQANIQNRDFIILLFYFTSICNLVSHALTHNNIDNFRSHELIQFTTGILIFTTWLSAVSLQ